MVFPFACFHSFPNTKVENKEKSKDRHLGLWTELNRSLKGKLNTAVFHTAELLGAGGAGGNAQSYTEDNKWNTLSY